MTRVLSSRITIFYKTLFPLVWTVVLVSLGWTMRGVLGGSGPLAARLLLPVAAVAGTAFVYWYASSLRKVVLVNDSGQDWLLISNLTREVRVPLRSLTEVSCRRWSKGKEIVLRFDHDPGLGDKAVFVPKMKLVWGWSEHPYTAELRDLAARARGGGRT